MMNEICECWGEPTYHPVKRTVESSSSLNELHDPHELFHGATELKMIANVSDDVRIQNCVEAYFTACNLEWSILRHQLDIKRGRSQTTYRGR